MKVTIEIECETAGELKTHLEVITQTIIVRSRNDPSYDFETGTHFTDNNCYGSHEVSILGEQPKEL